MANLTGGEATIRALAAEGVRTIFGIPGTHSLPLFDALLDVPEIERITARHEQGAAFMADGYARASGKTGVCITSTGPGALNTLAAMGTAHIDSSPVLNIFTQIPTAAIGREKGHLHEVRDQLGMFSEVTKWRGRAESVSAIPGLVHAAMYQVQNGRPRPAALELPVDILNSSGHASILPPSEPVRRVADAISVSEAATALSASERPLIWAGGGVVHSEASFELVRLAEALQAPILCTKMAKGAIPDDHPLCLGCVATRKPIHDYLASCDAILVVGSRLDALDTRSWELTLPDAVIQIDVDPTEIGRNYPVTIGVAGDARDVLDRLYRMAEDTSDDRANRESEVAEIKTRIRQELLDRSGEAVGLIDEIQTALPRDTIVANDVTICGYWGTYLLDIYSPRSYLYPAGFATLGFGLPAAIGAKVAQPDRPVLVICGDGGFLYTATDLATAVHHGINVVALIVNDSQFGILEPQQMSRYGRRSMIDLTNPDFAAFARSFGAHGVTVNDFTEVGPAIRDAFGENRPAIVELRTKLQHPFDW